MYHPRVHILVLRAGLHIVWSSGWPDYIVWFFWAALHIVWSSVCLDIQRYCLRSASGQPTAKATSLHWWINTSSLGSARIGAVDRAFDSLILRSPTARSGFPHSRHVETGFTFVLQCLNSVTQWLSNTSINIASLFDWRHHCNVINYSAILVHLQTTRQPSLLFVSCD